MIVTLMGPDDLGFWFLTADDGNSYQLVATHEDYLNAAMLGWERPAWIDDEKAIMTALDWLMEHTGDNFVSPQIVAEYFE
jgi:hypothetical protein